MNVREAGHDDVGMNGHEDVERATGTMRHEARPEDGREAGPETRRTGTQRRRRHEEDVGKRARSRIEDVRRARGGRRKGTGGLLEMQARGEDVGGPSGRMGRQGSGFPKQGSGPGTGHMHGGTGQRGTHGTTVLVAAAYMPSWRAVKATAMETLLSTSPVSE
ncbi:hypothetical protein TYRP_019396 [Tyrophagus putrescentiae]|nr:hypothetical protein TYRP_019396 [Tyrophagus putrescentiae]